MVSLRDAIFVGIAVIALVFPAIASPQAVSPAPNSFLVVADPQIHNSAGGSVKQTLRISDWASRVAQRYPELNLLAEYVFDDLIRRADKHEFGIDSNLVVLLGDGTNAACTGEFDKFNSHLEALRDAGKLVLWAHGNHDSYLMGTANTYSPKYEDEIVLGNMRKAQLPIDASWWKLLDQDQPLRKKSAWNSLCTDGHGSLPMNKGQWIARYLASFGNTLELKPTPSDDGSYLIEGYSAHGSKLANLGFEVRGRWYPPDSAKYPSSYLQRPYKSYIVQAINIGQTHRLVLIDTSVCDDTGRGTSFLKKNAGTSACISKEELDDIKNVSLTSGRRLIFAGHFPLHKMSLALRTLLLNEFNRSKQPWTYISGHTHDPQSLHAIADDVRYSDSPASQRYDFNFGSTTDWPMEAHRVMLDDSEQGLKVASVGYLNAPRIRYQPPQGKNGWEICRHLKAAQLLADLPVNQSPIEYVSPNVTKKDYRECEANYRRSLAAFDAARAKIKSRMAERTYHDVMLRIAISASEAEHRQKWVGKYIVIP